MALEHGSHHLWWCYHHGVEGKGPYPSSMNWLASKHQTFSILLIQLGPITLENSSSLSTIRPSFSVNWNQSRQVIWFPVKLWKLSCPMTPSMISYLLSITKIELLKTHTVFITIQPLFSMEPLVKSPTTTIFYKYMSYLSPKVYSSRIMSFWGKL